MFDSSLTSYFPKLEINTRPFSSVRLTGGELNPIGFDGGSSSPPEAMPSVVQAVRGREDSGGEWQPWVNERKDGYDTIDWISRQSWSDGKVGMIGGSYLGEVQLLAAAEGHPALKCIVPYISGSEHFFGEPYDYGVLNLEFLDGFA